MTIAILGSPGFHPLELVGNYIEALPKDTRVITGGNSRVDTLVTWAASRVMGLPVVVSYEGYPAIVAQAEKLVAFWDGRDMDIQDTINAAVAAGKPTETHYESGKVVER